MGALGGAGNLVKKIRILMLISVHQLHGYITGKSSERRQEDSSVGYFSLLTRSSLSLSLSLLDTVSPLTLILKTRPLLVDSSYPVSNLPPC